MEEIRNRLQAVKKESKYSYKVLAEKLDDTEDRLKGIFGGRQRVASDLLSKVVSSLHVDAHWLLTGEGQMYQSDQPAINETPAIYRSDIIDNRNQAQITAFIEHWYKTSSDEEKVWMNIQMQRCFPEYKDFITDSKADSSSQKKQAGE